MTQATNNSNKRSKGGWLTASLLLALALCSQAFAAPVSYTYDDLNRITEVSYDNGQQVITYTYDAAGNILSKTIIIAEQLSPGLSITSPANGAVVNTGNVTITGTATDAGQGDSGIASVMVNAIEANNSTASGSAVANWSLNVGLLPGTNVFTVIATDDSPWSNQTTQNLTIISLPVIVDGDSDSLPDVWETANGLDPADDGTINPDSGPSGDPDGDGFTNAEEYKAGTDPQLNTSMPEGAGGVNYVLFRDHFDDSQYEDRWYFGAMDVDTDFTLTEGGTELQDTVLRPTEDCKSMRLQNFATVDATDVVFHVELVLDGYGQTVIGLMQNVDLNNRIEILIDGDQSPYLLLRSWDAGVLTEVPAAVGTSYQGGVVDLRLINTGADFKLYVNNVYQGAVTNNGLGDVNLRPYFENESCLIDTGYVDNRIDLIELLLDRDGDGLADVYEDANTNGIVDDGESDPLNPDSDSDTVLDGYDNCLLKINTPQYDSDGDGYGNICDGDLNNDQAVNIFDLGLFKQRFGTTDPDADFNGDGGVNIFDLGLFKQMFGKQPGPSGLVP